MTEVQYGRASPVQGYGPGFFRIADRVIEGSLLVLPGQDPAGWGGYADTDPLLAAAGRIDVLLLGTGEATAHPPAAFRQALEAAGIGLEAMATGPACRTYNVLLGEGRRIGLAALAV